MSQPGGWRYRISPWDAWVVFVAIVGLALWLIIDHTQYPQMPELIRWSIAAVLVAVGLLFALAETADSARRHDHES